jgi:hypothetical protein
MERYEFENGVKTFIEQKLGEDGEVKPVLIVAPPKAGFEGFVVIPAGTKNEVEKDSLAFFISHLRGISPMFAFVTEAWALIKTAKEMETNRTMPSESPDRDEVMMANFYYGLDAISSMAPILRHSEGVTLGPWEDMGRGQNNKMGGRFFRPPPSAN